MATGTAGRLKKGLHALPHREEEGDVQTEGSEEPYHVPEQVRGSITESLGADVIYSLNKQDSHYLMSDDLGR